MIWLEMETENYEQMASKFVWEICRESVLSDLLSSVIGRIGRVNGGTP